MNTKNLFINLTDPVVFQSFGGSEYWERVSFNVGENIFKESDESKDFYYVFSGQLKVVKSIKDTSGTEKFIANLFDGDFFGEGALLSDKERACTVTALTDCVLLRLSQDKFQKLLVLEPNIAVGIVLGIVKVLNARLQETNERLVSLHNTAKLVRTYQGNMEALIPKVFKEFEGVLHHGVLVLFDLNGFAKFASTNTEPQKIDKIKTDLGAIFEAVKKDKSIQSYLSGDYIYLPVYNLSGDLSALLTAQICKDCSDSDSRLLITLAEQMSHLV